MTNSHADLHFMLRTHNNHNDNCANNKNKITVIIIKVTQRIMNTFIL